MFLSAIILRKQSASYFLVKSSYSLTSRETMFD